MAYQPEHLLAQIPLTVSPFISLPKPPTLPYTYKPVPATLPPSITTTTSTTTTAPTAPSTGSSPSPSPSSPPSTTNNNDSTTTTKAAYIISPTGATAAHPDDILASCDTLQHHIARLAADEQQMVRAWEEDIRQRELAEMRRVAPGWLDREEKLLVPDTTGAATGAEEVASQGNAASAATTTATATTAGLSKEAEELDRAFGGFGLK